LHGVAMTGYSRRPTAINAARRFLIGCVNRSAQDLPTYGDVAASYGGIARGVGPVLNSIRRECDAEGLPDLTALVVDKASQLPGTFNGAPVSPGSPNEARWREHLREIRNQDWRSWG
jgi:hypothetical protein